MKFLFPLFFLVIMGFILTSCGDDEPMPPPAENEEEIITDVTLVFTPSGGGTAVTARASDPDGDGPQDLQILDNIELSANASYTLTMNILNSLTGENIGEEIEMEGDEHQFFFAWTNNAFSNPTGNGNIDNSSDPMNYLDTDTNGLPLGLATEWDTGNALLDGTFRVILKHQPGSKSANSGSNTGDTDIDLSWVLNING